MRMRSVPLAALVGVLVLTGCTADGDAVDPQAGSQNRYVAGNGTTRVFEPAERRAAPEVRGDLLDGGSFTLKRLRGKVVVINFWASWCAPCRLEAPELTRVHRKTRAEGVEFVGVNIRDEEDKARAFEKSFDVTYPSIFDPAGRVALRFRDVPPNTIPATIVIDRKGRVAAVFRKAVLTEDLLPVVRDIAGGGPEGQGGGKSTAEPGGR